VNTHLCSEATEVGAMVRARIAAEGGVDVLRRCVDDPHQRAHVGRMLDELGIWEIEIQSGAAELEIAAEVCRAAGHYALPYPVVERLGASGAELSTLVARQGSPIVSHADLGLRWNAFDLEGRRYAASTVAGQPPTGARLAPFSAEVRVEPDADKAVFAREAAILVVLQSWWLLGLLQNAIDDTAQYVGEREQFGRRLAQFQAVAFRLTDMTLEVASTEALAKYAVWSLSHNDDPDEALVEGLGLRVAVQRAAGVVLRGAHQLHGAMGFTDEVDVAWLSRASQPVRRLPEDSHRTAELFRFAVERRGFSALGQVRQVVPAESP
jgi:hypothetical protein